MPPSTAAAVDAATARDAAIAVAALEIIWLTYESLQVAAAVLPKTVADIAAYPPLGSASGSNGGANNSAGRTHGENRAPHTSMMQRQLVVAAVADAGAFC